MDHNKQYVKLISKAGHRQDRCPEKYYEKHHIVPVCMGGKDEKENLVWLSAKEHFVAHHILCKIFPNDYKLASAFNLMCCHTGNRRSENINSRLFSIARNNFSKNHPMKNKDIRNRVSEWHKEYQSKQPPTRDKTTKQSMAARKKWTDYYDGLKVSHYNGYPYCKQCGVIVGKRDGVFCSKECHYTYQTNNFYRSPESHQKMVCAIKNSISKLSPKEKEDRLKKSMHSPANLKKRGERISLAKRGKKTNQWEIMGRRFANMTDTEFEIYLNTISYKTRTRSINLRLKWKKIIQSSN